MGHILAALVLAVTGAGDTSPAAPPWGKVLGCLQMPSTNLGFVSPLECDDFGHFWLGTHEEWVGSLRAEVRKTPPGGIKKADLCLQLASLLEEGGTGEGKEWFARAIGLYRKHTATRQKDAAVLSRLGYALACVGGDDKAAETVLRRTLRLAPDEWLAWVGLGRLAEHRALAALFRRYEKDGGGLLKLITLWAKSPKEARAKLPAEDLRQAARLLTEATACYDKAVAASPNAAGPYTSRTRHRLRRRIFEGMFHLPLPGTPESRRPLITPEDVADYYRAAANGPRDPVSLLLPLWLEVFRYAAENDLTVPGGPRLWAVLPDGVKKKAHGTFAALETLAESRNPQESAKAYEAIAFLHWVFCELDKAEVAATKALALDPGRRAAVRIMLSVYPVLGKRDELLRFCEARVRQEPSALNSYLLARTLAQCGELAEARRLLREVLKKEPQDFSANLGLAVLLFWQGTASSLLDRSRALIQTKALLDVAEKRLRGLSRDNQVEFALARSAHFVLAGDPARARKVLRDVIRDDAESEPARKMLALFEDQPTEPPPPPSYSPE